MLSSKTGVFREPDDYEAALQADYYSSLVVTQPGPFRAHLTQIALHRSRLQGGGETLPRILFLSLPNAATLVAFPIGPHRPPIWGGLETSVDEIVIIGGGSRLHTRSGNAGRWGTVLLATDLFETYSRTVMDAAFTLPLGLCVWRPPALARRELVRLHTSAMSVARTHLGLLTAAEPAMGLEQEMLDAVTACLAGGGPAPSRDGMADQLDLMARVETLLATNAERSWTLAALTETLEVTGPVLDACCKASLGMGPVAYGNLRRLELIRRALRRPDPALATVAEVAVRYGYLEPSEFASAYLASFGELPSMTLRRGARP